MQIVRTILWVLLAVLIAAFSVQNWKPVEVTLWEGIVLETKVAALVIVALLLGGVPMWLYHRSVKWGLSRRIRSLENSIKSSALAHRDEPAVTHTPATVVDTPSRAPVSEPAPVEKSEDKPAEPADNLSPASEPHKDIEDTTDDRPA